LQTCSKYNDVYVLRVVSCIFFHHLKSYPLWVIVLEESVEDFWKGDLVKRAK